jgi:hypothetical protein
MQAVSMLRVATLAPSDDAPAARIRGTITAVSADALTVEADSGSILDVTLRADRVARAITLGSVEEIQTGRYIGTAVVPQADGTLKALEVHVFPPEMAGTGDGHRLWDLTPDSSMTNGIVGELPTSKGRIITVKYKEASRRWSSPTACRSRISSPATARCWCPAPMSCCSPRRTRTAY